MFLDKKWNWNYRYNKRLKTEKLFGLIEVFYCNAIKHLVQLVGQVTVSVDTIYNVKQLNLIEQIDTVYVNKIMDLVSINWSSKIRRTNKLF
jgi:hypothetical protein